MFKIGEFSKLTQVSIRMLRYYDEMGLLKPYETDTFTGYRLYSVEQIPVLNKIIYLRDSGFNVAEIAVALAANNVDIINEQFNKKYNEIEKNIELEKIKLQKIELAQKEFFSDKNELLFNVAIKSIPSYYVLSLRRIISNYYSEKELWDDIDSFAKKQQININNKSFSIYHDDDYREKNVDVEICIPVEKLNTNINKDGFIFKDIESIPIMACTMVYGKFSNIAGAFFSLAKWLQENEQYEMGGKDRQIIHRGPWNETDSSKYLVEIQIPLKKRK